MSWRNMHDMKKTYQNFRKQYVSFYEREFENVLYMEK